MMDGHNGPELSVTVPMNASGKDNGNHDDKVNYIRCSLPRTISERPLLFSRRDGHCTNSLDMRRRRRIGSVSVVYPCFECFTAA